MRCYSGFFVHVCLCSLLSEHLAGLLCDTDESGSLAQLFKLGCTHISAGGAQPPQHVPNGVLHISSVGNLHRLPLWSPGCRDRETCVRLLMPVNFVKLRKVKMMWHLNRSQMKRLQTMLLDKANKQFSTVTYDAAYISTIQLLKLLLFFQLIFKWAACKKCI